MLRATLATTVGALFSWAVLAFGFSVFGAYDPERMTAPMLALVATLSVSVGFVYSRWFWVTGPAR